MVSAGRGTHHQWIPIHTAAGALLGPPQVGFSPLHGLAAAGLLEACVLFLGPLGSSLCSGAPVRPKGSDSHVGRNGPDAAIMSQSRGGRGTLTEAHSGPIPPGLCLSQNFKVFKVFGGPKAPPVVQGHVALRARPAVIPRAGDLAGPKGRRVLHTDS